MAFSLSNTQLYDFKHFSSREGIRLRRFYVLLLAILAQSVAAMIVAVPAGRWRSFDRDRGYRPFWTVRRFIQQTLARESVFAIVVVCFSGIKNV